LLVEPSCQGSLSKVYALLHVHEVPTWDVSVDVLVACSVYGGSTLSHLWRAMVGETCATQLHNTLECILVQ
jgi:hypothetical protein